MRVRIDKPIKPFTRNKSLRLILKVWICTNHLNSYVFFDFYPTELDIKSYINKELKYLYNDVNIFFYSIEDRFITRYYCGAITKEDCII